MTLDEAFAELGLDPDAGSDGARRAYLRLLKTRKPETDPEGFMRLRAAYELVKADLPFFEAFRAREPAARVVEETPAPVVEPLAAPEEPLVAIEEPPVAPEEPLAAVEEPLAAIPALPAQVDSAPDEGEAPVDRGDVDVMEALLARSAYEGAATQALLILESATHRLDQRDPPVLSCLRLMLGLHRISEPEKAREVSTAFKAWLAATGKESTQIRGHAAVLWTLVRELDGMKKGLPDRVRTAIALAALAGDLDLAQPDLVSFHGKQRAAARAAGGLLRRKAPAIAAALANTLDPPEPVVPRTPPPSYQRGEKSSKGLWFIPMLALGLIRIFLAAGRSSPSYPTYSSPLSGYQMPRVPYPTMGFDAGGLAASMSELERLQLLSRARQIASAAGSNGKINLRALSAVTALEAHRCDKVLADAAAMRAEAVKTKKTILPVLDADIVLFDASAHRYCDKRAQADAEAGLNEVVEADAGPGDAGARDAGRRGKTMK